jgi:hypothetical protein
MDIPMSAFDQLHRRLAVPTLLGMFGQAVSYRAPGATEATPIRAMVKRFSVEDIDEAGGRVYARRATITVREEDAAAFAIGGVVTVEGDPFALISEVSRGSLVVYEGRIADRRTYTASRFREGS